MTDVPEQVTSRKKDDHIGVTHSLRADPDWTQSGRISHVDLSVESFLSPVETTDPQCSSLQTTAADVRVQLES